MALTITEMLIRGDRTTYTSALGDKGWSVTWLPGRAHSESSTHGHADRTDGR
jgi:hypothetical protein